MVASFNEAKATTSNRSDFAQILQMQMTLQRLIGISWGQREDL